MRLSTILVISLLIAGTFAVAAKRVEQPISKTTEAFVQMTDGEDDAPSDGVELHKALGGIHDADGEDAGEADQEPEEDETDPAEPEEDETDPAEPEEDEAAEPEEDEAAEPEEDEAAEPADDETAEPADDEAAEPEEDEAAEPEEDEAAEPADDEAAEPADDEAAEPADDETAEPADDEAAEPEEDEAAEPEEDEAAEPADDEAAEPSADEAEEETESDGPNDGVELHKALGGVDDEEGSSGIQTSEPEPQLQVDPAPQPVDAPVVEEEKEPEVPEATVGQGNTTDAETAFGEDVTAEEAQTSQVITTDQTGAPAENAAQEVLEDAHDDQPPVDPQHDNALEEQPNPLSGSTLTNDAINDIFHKLDKKRKAKSGLVQQKYLRTVRRNASRHFE